MNKKNRIRFSKQCAGFGCDRNDNCETCKICYIYHNELYKACVLCEKKIEIYEKLRDTKS